MQVVKRQFLNIRMNAYNGMRFGFYPVQTKIIEDDIPLADFSKVQQTLRKEIESGHIRKILEMRLGYASVDVRDDPEGYTGSTKPIWHVEVWWCKDGKAKMKEDDPEYPTNDHGKLECARIAIDAQTGGIVSIAGTYAPKQKKGQGIENTMAISVGYNECYPSSRTKKIDNQEGKVYYVYVDNCLP